MNEAKEQIEEWFDKKENEIKVKFSETVLKNVKFIWYESVDEDPIKVFTRLNIGKISLTNAELIKALFLNRSNFCESDYEKLRLLQQEIASEWDSIEYTLQSNEFWLFLHNKGYDKPTRIDFIFDIICENDVLHLKELLAKKNKKYSDEKEYNVFLGKDRYKTFRYFYTWFRTNKRKENIILKENLNIIECWKEVKTIFQTFQEWYNDLELYHYIGFMRGNIDDKHKVEIIPILKKWNEVGMTKEIFLSKYIKKEIVATLKDCIDLNKQYETNYSPKTQCRPILLLHNIQTIINQNKSLKNNDKYKLPIFYKFPFHLFKLEKWDVEHIDSHSENPLEKIDEQKEWLKCSYDFIDDQIKIDGDKNLKEEIKYFLSDPNCKLNFYTLWDGVNSSYTSDYERLKNEEKNKLWNFTLLDASTNRGYGNSIFPAKRRIIIGKDKGKYIHINDEMKATEVEGAIAFIPPCTKNVFLKYYNLSTNNLREWDKDDAIKYLEDIKSVLKQFLTNQQEK
jgi:hypothetical protein